MSVRLDQLRSFEAVARLRNFTRAAEELFIAQPSLSRQIGALEAGVVRPSSRFPVETSTSLEGVQLENANGEACGGTLRESFAELRSIAADVDDTELRARIAQVERRLVTLAGETVPVATGPVPTVHLSPRETDVLACAALGSTNAEIAAQLGLREGTVKAYLGTAD